MLRLPNLLIIALTFFFLRYLVFIPVYLKYSVSPCMGGPEYSLLIIATMLIAAAGYIANDYFDVFTDRINKPRKQYIGILIKPGSAFTSAVMLSILAVAIAAWLSLSKQSWLMPGMLIVALMVVWWYASMLKRSLLWGNIAVSCMSAGTIVMAWVAEMEYSILPAEASALISKVIMAVSIFAFLLSLLREIVKDIEDMEGDLVIKCRSLPIVKGLPFTKKVLLALALITILLLITIQICLIQQQMIIAVAWLLITVELPLVYFMSKLKKLQSKDEFHSMSRLLKLIMIGGIVSLVAGQY
jgi:4-hydroxybenzoate polyprenyltransferase